MTNPYARIEAEPGAEPVPFATPASARRWRNAVLAMLAVVVVALAIAIWATDFMTMEGEWTIYTASCDGGRWDGDRCVGGKFSAGERFRFRSLKAHHEVLFWTVGATSGESGRYTQCDIRDGRNWTCPVNDHASRTITHQLARGLPDDGAGDPHQPYHRVAKWKWEALRQGIPVGSTAAP